MSREKQLERHSKKICKVLLEEVGIEGVDKDKICDLALVFMCLRSLKDALLKFIHPQEIFDHKDYGEAGMQAMIRTIVLISKLESHVDLATGGHKSSLDDELTEKFSNYLEDKSSAKDLLNDIGVPNGIDITQQGEA